ncbi:hypothetical protein JTE90_026444 [Oedothorax gibbosus]|uniref:Uncharacterized protein n=1 Tax=Oedothorax gibbosus TaxID=931172 RepID=A0AAV6VS02_9ARAC|nr:hypothetical protein JTE90_026444 [Oedothorax gibbosus]
MVLVICMRCLRWRPLARNRGKRRLSTLTLHKTYLSPRIHLIRPSSGTSSPLEREKSSCTFRQLTESFRKSPISSFIFSSIFSLGEKKQFD